MNLKKFKLWYLIPLVGLAAFIWLPFAQTTDCAVQTQIDKAECDALVDLYTSTNATNWSIWSIWSRFLRNKSGWNITNTPCSWKGISCSDGHVTKLYLYNKQLSGSIPESLGNLSNLKSLSLGKNQLSGSIPESLGKLSNLERLFLNKNQLSGSIPESLGNLSNLKYLELSENQLSGIIPESLNKLSNLEILELFGNQLSGSITNCAVQSQIDEKECHALVDFYTSTNGSNWKNNKGWNVTNTPCSWHGVSCRNGHVDGLFLGGNNINGSIPKSLLNLKKLKNFYLEYNQLLIGNACNKLIQIYIDEKECNALVDFYTSTNGTNWKSNKGWNVTNDPCHWIGVSCDGGHVTRLYLRGNNLSGSIPKSLSKLSYLQVLNLNNNQLSDSIPESLGKLSNLIILELGTNQLSGSIPKSLSNLSNLTTLNLGANQLSGSIPESLDKLSNLNVLTLSNNQLSSTTSITDCAVQLQIDKEECYALVDFYTNTDGDNWQNNTGWNTTNLPCTWNGVSCREGHVTGLNLRKNQLSGSVPESLGKLSYLQYLNLSNNQLSGSIPESLSNLSNLNQLRLNNNQLNGSIPESLGNLNNLRDLYLYENQLSGSIPESLGKLSKLTWLSLHKNQLSGSIPESLGKLSELMWINLRENQLSGSIPESLGELGFPFSELDLSNNHLSGSIPESLGKLGFRFFKLDLSNNQLSGSIPESLGNLSNLRFLNLYKNQLSGSIPESLGNLKSLQVLELHKNKLSGSIPKSLSKLNRLQKFDLHENQLGGSIPELSAGLIDLSNNQLTGSIPKLLGLNKLYLNNNQLSGSIPASLGYLSHLNKLHLNNNQLSGSIPKSLGKLEYLRSLHLSNNNLSGSIPESLSNLRLTSLWLGHNQLSDSIPESVLKSLKILGLSHNQVNDTTTDCAVQTQIPEKECHALLDLYNKKYRGGRWNMTNTPCDWPRVLCSDGHVTELNLYKDYYGGGNVMLNDFIPESLGNLRYLKSLNLNDHNLKGSIPESLGKLSNLKILYLGSNQLSGSIPESLGKLSKLKWLDLSSNQLSGPIPSLVQLSKLNRLILDSNQLSGSITDCAVQIQIDEKECHVLVDFYTSTNGANWRYNNGWNVTNVPCTWSGVSCEDGHVTELYLSNKQLNGSIPESFGNLSHLKILRLNNNQLSGSLPESLGKLSKLEDLYLSENQLSGTLPKSLGKLSKLKTLYLNNNQLSGSIPESLVKLSKLKYFELGNNQLSSNTDYCTVQIQIDKEECYALVDLYTSTNAANWSYNAGWNVTNIPCIWEGVKCDGGHVTELWLNNKGLRGSIPESLGNLVHLKTLRIYSNQLSGSIPESLSKLNYLQVLDLNYNQLTNTSTTDCAVQIQIDKEECYALVDLYSSTNGTNWRYNNGWNVTNIPCTWNGVSCDDRHVTELRLSNNKLCGDIPLSLMNLSKINYLRLGANHLTVSDPKLFAWLKAKQSDWANKQTLLDWLKEWSRNNFPF